MNFKSKLKIRKSTRLEREREREERSGKKEEGREIDAIRHYKIIHNYKAAVVIKIFCASICWL